MAANGPGVLENDLALDVHDAFFEQFDGGSDPGTTRDHLLHAHEGEAQGDAEREIVLAALLQCLWDVGHPVDDLRGQLQEIVVTGVSAAHWGHLTAERTRTLRRLLAKTATPKKAPTPRRKARLPKKLAFEAGDYLAFTKASGRVVPVIVWLVERRAPLRYDFVFPNLGRSADPALLARLLDTREPVSDEELAAFLSPGRRPRVFSLEHTTIKPHLGRFRTFGNRPFSFPAWQCGACGYGVTFADFERRADEGGCRAMTPSEIAFIASRAAG